MASITANISNATPPYTISVKKVGDPSERFISFSGGTITFNPSFESGEVYYTVEIKDANQCEWIGNFSLVNCDIDCGALPIINITNLNCSTHEITFTVTGDTEMTVDIWNDVNGTFYFQDHQSGDTITTPVPINYSSTIQVYKKNTNFKCFSLATINPDCTPTCSFSFGIINVFCPTSTVPVGSIQISTLPSVDGPYTFSVKEQNSSIERFIDYKIQYSSIEFNQISDGTPHSYILTITDKNGCFYSQSFSLSCLNQVICTPLDVMFCVDSSGSIGAVNYGTMKGGILNLIDKLAPSMQDQTVKVGLVQFSSWNNGPDFHLVHNLTFDVNSLKSAIQNMSWVGGNTPMCTGMQYSNQRLRDPFYAQNSNKKLVVISDGDPNSNNNCGQSDSISGAKYVANNIKTTPFIGTNSQSYSVEIMTVGITNSINEPLLRDFIASTPQDYYYADTFNDFANLADEITEGICS